MQPSTFTSSSSSSSSAVAAMMHDVTDPSDWHGDFAALRNLDASLRCELCFDIYSSPVSLKRCNHTFCSTCIRTHINQSGNSGSFCPKCRQNKAYDSELVPQPLLEITALEWKRARLFLARLQAQPPPTTTTTTTTTTTANATPQSPRTASTPSPRRSKRIRIDSNPNPNPNPAPPDASTGSRSSPLTVHDDDDSDYIDAGEPAQPERQPDRELKADDLVQCPICSHRFTVTALNRHLDSANCHPGFPEPTPEERGLAPRSKPSTTSWFTSNASASTSTSTSTSTSNTESAAAMEKRLVRPQYNLRSERELRKLLDDAGLPTAGDRERLVERHRQWINLWNANLDSTKARRTAAQLRKELAAWERTRASAKDHTAQVERQRQTWVSSNKSHFDQLVQQARSTAKRDKHLHQPTQPPATEPPPLDASSADRPMQRDFRDKPPSYLLTSVPLPAPPTPSVSRLGSYEIPRAAIRIDGSSYMDQGVGGCPSLWTPDADQSVPEMDLLGYKLAFREAQYDDKGKVLKEAGLDWLDAGIDMVRISNDQPRW